MPNIKNLCITIIVHIVFLTTTKNNVAITIYSFECNVEAANDYKCSNFYFVSVEKLVM